MDLVQFVCKLIVITCAFLFYLCVADEFIAYITEYIFNFSTRSHCRICCAAVCITCHVIVYDTFKICTRCHIKQKEDELSTQMALSAITNAKNCSQYENLSFASTKDSSQEKKNEILISASKKGKYL